MPMRFSQCEPMRDSRSESGSTRRIAGTRGGRWGGGVWGSGGVTGTGLSAFALDAIDAGRQLGQNLAKRFQVAVRSVHEGSRALSAKRMRLARYFCRGTAGHGGGRGPMKEEC